jgi:hypothetical protein
VSPLRQTISRSERGLVGRCRVLRGIPILTDKSVFGRIELNRITTAKGDVQRGNSLRFDVFNPRTGSCS